MITKTGKQSRNKKKKNIKEPQQQGKKAFKKKIRK